jgi:hypothetical protein
MSALDGKRTLACGPIAALTTKAADARVFVKPQ